MQIQAQVEELKGQLLGVAGVPEEARGRVLRFYELLLKGNEEQNLTRLTSPADFISGHLLDCVEFLKYSDIPARCMDLGSGCGVPGLLCACIEPERTEWLLCESETRKAVFLEQTAGELGLSGRVKVFSGRGEDALKKEETPWIVTRAVGKVEKIYNWLLSRSTWNTIILFKGPGWDEEWKAFQETPLRDELRIQNIHEYSVPSTSAIRRMVRVARVPRGTKIFSK